MYEFPEMIQSGDVLLCKGKGLIPWIIKWGTKSVYSHVAIIASAEHKLVIEAIPEGGVRAISLENFHTPFEIYRVKKEHSFNHTGVVSYLILMLARKYDFLSAVKFGWKLFKRKMGIVQLAGLKVVGLKEKADALQENQDFFCSELCYRAFNEGGGLDIVPQIGDAETTSPGDIARSPILTKVA